MVEDAVEGTWAPRLGGRGGTWPAQSAAWTSGDFRMFCMTIRNSSSFGTLRATHRRAHKKDRPAPKRPSPDKFEERFRHV